MYDGYDLFATLFATFGALYHGGVSRMISVCSCSIQTGKIEINGVY